MGVIDGSPKFQHQAAVKDRFVSTLKSLLLLVTHLCCELHSPALNFVPSVILDVTNKMTASKSRRCVNVLELVSPDLHRDLVAECLWIVIHLTVRLSLISLTYVEEINLLYFFSSFI